MIFKSRLRRQHIKFFFRKHIIFLLLVFCSMSLSQTIQLLCEKPISEHDRQSYEKSISKTNKNILNARCAEPPAFDLFGANARRCERLEKKLQDLKNCSRSRASDTYAMNINIGAIDRQGILSTDFQISHCMSNWLEQNCAQMKKICTGTFQLSNTPDLLSFYLPESAHRDARFNVDRANMRAGWDLNRNFVCRTVTSDHSDSANQLSFFYAVSFQLITAELGYTSHM